MSRIGLQYRRTWQFLNEFDGRGLVPDCPGAQVVLASPLLSVVTVDEPTVPLPLCGVKVTSTPATGLLFASRITTRGLMGRSTFNSPV